MVCALAIRDGVVPPTINLKNPAGPIGNAVTFAGLLDSSEPLPDIGTGTTWDETTRLYTSGTTGMPKGVPLPALAEVLTAHDVIMHFPLTPEDKTLNMTPWFHRVGISPGGLTRCSTPAPQPFPCAPSTRPHASTRWPGTA
jgi:acyl-CoA synthetase (AMP-forming)/AMP-acid ligase II